MSMNLNTCEIGKYLQTCKHSATVDNLVVDSYHPKLQNKSSMVHNLVICNTHTHTTEGW